MASGEPRWQPADRLERGLLIALRAGDREGYVRLLRGAPLLLPVAQDAVAAADIEAEAAAEAAADGGAAGAGDPPLYCFTSAGAVSAALPEQQVPCVRASLADLASGARRRLVVNPGTPLRLAVDAALLAALTDPDDAGDLPELAPVPHGALPYANALEESLAQPGVLDNPGEAFKLLLLTELVLPAPGTPPQAAPPDAGPDEVGPDEAGPGEPGFRWPVYRTGHGRGVVAFTSLLRCTASLGTVPTLAVPALDLLLAWPGQAYTLVVNPGGELELVLSGERVLALRDWIDEVGLAETI